MGAEFLEVEVTEGGAGQGGVHQGERAMRVVARRVEPKMKSLNTGRDTWGFATREGGEQCRGGYTNASG